MHMMCMVVFGSTPYGLSSRTIPSSAAETDRSPDRQILSERIERQDTAKPICRVQPRSVYITLGLLGNSRSDRVVIHSPRFCADVCHSCSGTSGELQEKRTTRCGASLTGLLFRLLTAIEDDQILYMSRCLLTSADSKRKGSKVLLLTRPIFSVQLMKGMLAL